MTVSSVALLLVAVFIRKATPAYFAAVLSVPISYVLAGYPISFYVPLIFPLLLWGGGMIIKRKHVLAGSLLFLPYFLLVTFVIINGFILDRW